MLAIMMLEMLSFSWHQGTYFGASLLHFYNLSNIDAFFATLLRKAGNGLN